MKTIVLDLDTLEQEIKPQAMIDEYRRMIAEDLRQMAAEPAKLTPVACPGCAGKQSHFAFVKLGFTYLECAECRSVYVSPRPSEAALAEFYRHSKSARYWREEILRQTREARREKLIRPRARWLLDAVDEYRPDAKLGLVVGFHNDLLVEELAARETNLFKLSVTNEIADMEFAGLNIPGVDVKPSPLADLKALGPADLFLAFDILDRCFDVEAVFTAAKEALAPGGLLLATTTLAGFDLQVLWEKTNSVYPPERLNLLSAQALTALYERHGFEALEFSTPGMFDVAVVRRAIEADPDRDWPRFIRYLLANKSAEALDDLQEYLQQYRLSSFARIVLRRL